MKYLDFNTKCNSNNIPFPIHNCQILWDGKQSAHGKESPAKTAGSVELLREAMQLLKTLRLPSVKRLQKIDGYDGTKDLVVLDSGATHILRQGMREWRRARPTQVALAEGVTEDLRLLEGTRTLVSRPEGRESEDTWKSTMSIPMHDLSANEYEEEFFQESNKVYFG